VIKEYETINEHDAEPVNGHVPLTTTQPHDDDVNANSEKPSAPADEQHKANGIDPIPGQLPAR